MRYLKKSALDYVFDKLVFSRKTFLTFKLNQSILDLLFWHTWEPKSAQFSCLQPEAWTKAKGRSFPPTPTTSLSNYGGWWTTHWKGPSSGTARARPSSSTSCCLRGRSWTRIPTMRKTCMPLRPPISPALCGSSTCTASRRSRRCTKRSCLMPTVPPGFIITSWTQTSNRTSELARFRGGTPSGLDLFPLSSLQCLHSAMLAGCQLLCTDVEILLFHRTLFFATCSLIVLDSRI